MTERGLFQTLEKAIDAFAAKPSGEAFLDMQRSGLIDADGKMQEWDASLAIVATNATDSRKATHFRCRKPALGLPGGAEIDVSRENMERYLNEGKRIITAVRNKETGALLEGEVVRLTSHNTVRTDNNDTNIDDLGDLPTFDSVKTWV